MAPLNKLQREKLKIQQAMEAARTEGLSMKDEFVSPGKEAPVIARDPLFKDYKTSVADLVAWVMANTEDEIANVRAHVDRDIMLGVTIIKLVFDFENFNEEWETFTTKVRVADEIVLDAVLDEDAFVEHVGRMLLAGISNSIREYLGAGQKDIERAEN